MSEDELQLIREIKKVITELPAADRKLCAALAQQIRELTEEHGPTGLLALALVGAEKQAGL